MRSIKRDLIGLSIFLAILLAFAATRGRPFLNGTPAYADGDVQQATQPGSMTFTGTVVKDGGQFVLREVAGVTYRLDGGAQGFEGKAVKVTGRLNAKDSVIRVKSIVNAE
jgi:hypothetical protein